jgi:hypothetical protein
MTLFMKRRDYEWQQNNTLTNSMNNTPIDRPSPTEAVPRTELQWSYQDGNLGSNSQDHMISCLLGRHEQK